MLHFDVNWLAIILATVASMALGMAWYMLLLKQWLSALGKSAEEIGARMGGGSAPFVWSALGQLVMAYFIALLTPLLMGETNWRTAISTGAHLWLGFILTSMIINHRYQGQKWALTVIDSGYLLGAVTIQGLVIGLFG